MALIESAGAVLYTEDGGVRQYVLVMEKNGSFGLPKGHVKTAETLAETTKREVDTRIRVRDGELFVIGGLYQENKTNNVTRVPVIGYIPLLGELFKTRTTQHSKSQMAVIAVAKILDIPSGAVVVIDMPGVGLRL